MLFRSTAMKPMLRATPFLTLYLQMKLKVLIKVYWCPVSRTPLFIDVERFRLRKWRYNTQRIIRRLLARRLGIGVRSITPRPYTMARWEAWIGIGPPALARQHQQVPRAHKKCPATCGYSFCGFSMEHPQKVYRRVSPNFGYTFCGPNFDDFVMEAFFREPSST